MNFNDFINRGQVRKGSRDVALAKSLVATSDIDLKFLKSLDITETSARKIMTNYYDVLRSLLEAVLALEGYKSYSHEAYTYFLTEKEEQLIADKFDRFRKIRNGINYYGTDVSVEEVKEHSEEMLKIIAVLKNKYLKELI